MKAVRLHIFRDLPNPGDNRITAEVCIPGLGNLDITDCLSHETAERCYKEVEEFTRNKFVYTQQVPKHPSHPARR